MKAPLVSALRVSTENQPSIGFSHDADVGVKCRCHSCEWLLRYPHDARVMAYIGRSGWNTLQIGGAIPDDEIREAIVSSYETVVAKLPKRDRPNPR